MRRQVNTRRLVSEQLEGRSLMAGDLSHNFLEPNDVNDDSRISPVDALLVINTLNDMRGNGGASSSSTSRFEDVNDDSRVSPTDALLVINQLTTNQTQVSSGGSSTSSSQIEARVKSLTSTAAAKIEFEQSGNEMELAVKLRDAAPSTTFPVHLNDFALGELITDARGRGMLKFANGDDNDRHLPWPANMPQLTADTELIIGDIVRAKLSGASLDDSSNGSSSGGNSNGGSDDSSNSGDDSGNDSSDDGSSGQQSGQWIAMFASVGSFTRKAEFEQETEDGRTKSKLEVEIEGALPNTSFSVSVAGVSLGEVQTNSRGKAKVIWSSAPRQGEQSLPSSFPTIAAATIIKIGDAEASFQ